MTITSEEQGSFVKSHKNEAFSKEGSNLESVHFGSENVGKMSKSKVPPKFNDIFHSNPINFANKTFDHPHEVFIKEISINLSTVIESYTKSIGSLSKKVGKLKRIVKINKQVVFFYRIVVIAAWKRFHRTGHARIGKHLSFYEKYQVLNFFAEKSTDKSYL